MYQNVVLKFFSLNDDEFSIIPCLIYVFAIRLLKVRYLMQALFIVLNDSKYMDDILEVFVKHGVKGATIVDSYGMGKALRESKTLNYLMKGSIERSVPEQVGDSKTIFSVIPDDDDSALIIKTIEHLLNYSKSDTVGFMFVVPVSAIIPMK